MIFHKIPKDIGLLDKYKHVLSRVDSVRSIGHIVSITGNIIRTSGPEVNLHDICHIMSSIEGEDSFLAEVVGFEKGLVLLAPLKEANGVRPGSRVVSLNEPLGVHINDHLIGRCINALGLPIDGRDKIITEDVHYLTKVPPPPLERPIIKDPLFLGVRAIDAFLTIGKGQRIGIFSGSGVGKSTLLGMIARYSKADVNVVGLIGERSREVNEFVQEELGEHGLERSILVVAAANESPMHKIKASFLATTIAEYFRDQGKDVLLLLDSLTRLAMAQREIGLASSEPATTKGYPPSVYSLIPSLLERAGTAKKGSITGVYTVLVEADDINDPVSDAVRGVMDGHILLDRELAHRSHFPAIDVPLSISRVMKQVIPKEDYDVACFLKELLSVYKENEEIIQLGAYSKGSDLLLDQAIQIKPVLDKFLKQSVDDFSEPGSTLKQMRSIYSLVSVSSTRPQPLQRVI